MHARGLAAVDRRRFLIGAAAAGPALFAGRALAADLPRGIREADWRGLGARLSAGLLRPDDAGFAAAAKPNNLRYADVVPQAIARCRTAEDVAATIGWCREHDMPFVVRAGGHSYAGFSTTHGVLLDVRPMNAIAFDAASGRVTIAGGALNRDVYAALRAHNAAITHGRCPTVGAAAFLLGGGIGFNMRRNGLACDRVVATELVIADGSRRATDARTDPALFWACRGGGGGNFGVSTSFTLETFPTEPVTVFSIRWTQRTEAVAEALMPALATAPDNLGSRVSFGAVTGKEQAAGEEVGIDLLGQFAGSAADLRSILAPAYAAGEPSRTDIREMAYWDGQTFLEEAGEPEFYQERSAFVPGTFGADALAEGFGWLRSWPGTHGYCDLRFFQTGGAINRVAPGATAFVHRDSEWLMVVGLYWEADDNADPREVARAHEWQDGFYAAMRRHAGGAYVNFPDPSLVDWRRAYYGANLEMLTRVKNAVDPAGVFAFPQAL